MIVLNERNIQKRTYRKYMCYAYALICVQLFSTPWTVAHQAPLSMRFSRQEYWGRLPFVPPRNLSNPGTESMSPASPALAARFFILSHLGSPNSEATGQETQCQVSLVNGSFCCSPHHNNTGTSGKEATLA